MPTITIWTVFLDSTKLPAQNFKLVSCAAIEAALGID